MGTIHQLRPKFPTPLERHLLDLPYEDDADFAIPSYDEMNPFTKSRGASPHGSRVGADANPTRQHRPRFIDLTKKFETAIEFALLIVILAIVLWAPL